MKIGSAFPSKWLKSEDIGNRRVRVTIDSVSLETVGDSDTPVVYFKGKEKGMVLNRTNAGTLTMCFGTDETEEWVGREIILKTEPVQYQGRMVRGLRVEVPQDQQAEEEEPPF